MGEHSSKEWNYAYVETNELITSLTTALHDLLVEKGYKASLLPPTYNFDPVQLTSEWSHRSAARVAGVGTFGINNMFITRQGSCGRLGSVITTAKLEPTPRPTVEHCLYERKGICKVCVDKCVNDALGFCDGQVWFDKHKCNEQLYEKEHPNHGIGSGDTCGKCMVGCLAR